MTELSIDGEELDALRDELIAAGKSASEAARDEDVSRLFALRRSLATHAKKATGVHLAMLEVAEAFVRRLLRGDVSHESVVLHQLMGGESDAARDLLSTLADGSSILRERLDSLMKHDEQLRAGFSELLARGVLEATPGRIKISAAWRARVQDIVEPTPFRVWRTVEWARKLASFERKHDARARIVAGVTGVTVGQASIFLEGNPLLQGATRELRAKPRYQRPAASGVPRVRLGDVAPRIRVADTAPEQGDSADVAGAENRVRTPEAPARNSRVGEETLTPRQAV